MQELLIETIRTDGGVQSRERINEEYVAELTALIKAGKKLPPIEVYSDGTDVWCADGFHRVVAHQQAGKRTIRCNRHKGGQQDAAWASCAANQEHGLRRTKGDLEHAVKMAVRIAPDKSPLAIAEHVGCHEDTAKRWRNQLIQGGELPPPEKVVGKDGKTYRVPPPPGTPRTPPLPVPQGDTTRKTLPPPCDNAGSTPPTTSQGKPNGSRPTPPPPVPAKAQKPVNRLDEVGKSIPDHLLPLFDRVPEVQALLGQISSVRGALREAEKVGDPLYGDCNMQAAQAALQTAFDTIKATTPYAVCPWCHGKMSDQCRGCGHRGVLGKYRWDTTVQRELK